jgi:hypothetical protein
MRECGRGSQEDGGLNHHAERLSDVVTHEQRVAFNGCSGPDLNHATVSTYQHWR